MPRSTVKAAEESAKALVETFKDENPEEER
jgi:hypothetical protein